jgi:4-amino-4-deoxy-L-arabinose transferase-like glycosyltransferase
MRSYLPYLLIILTAGLLFFHSLGAVSLFDWDEINFAESAREMLETGNFMRVQINYEPFWEKPPFFFWLQAASMHLFGVGEMAARFPNAICGIITLLVIYGIGSRLHGKRMATIWVVVYTATFLPHLYFKSGIIDPWFNLFIFLSIYFLSRYLSGKQADKFLIGSAFFAGMGIITKGPVALLIILLTYLIFFIVYRKSIRVSLINYLKWGLVTFLVTLFWFGLEVAQHGLWFVEEFITYQIRLAQTEDAGHGGFLLYHFVILLVGCFPASVFMWGKPGKESDEDGSDKKYFRTMMIGALAVILVVFTLVQTKIVHYSSFAYFPIGYLAAFSIYQVLERKRKLAKWQLILFLILGMLWGIVFALLPLIGNHPEWIRPLLAKDPFALANLQAEVNWGTTLMLPGIIFLIIVIWGYVLMRKDQLQKAIIVVLLACVGSMQVLLTLFAPRIEQYSQRAAIDFYKSIRDEQAFIATVGYKSYAHYFYAEVGKENGVIAKNADWILGNQLNRPAYLVSKITEKDRMLQQYPLLTVLYEKNGFVFYKKQPQ